jgi:sugar/nucleoside kinase (ribokinase family)
LKAGGTTRTLGVVGTLVWDSILPAEDAAQATEEWGGIAYSLAALDFALAADWVALPIVKVGRDVEGSAREFLDTLPRVLEDAIAPVAEPNNRVELRYRDAHERTETLSGGVPGWTAAELIDLASRCDALYLNFVSGFEMSLATAAELRQAFSGPIYVDLHSLFLGIDKRGRRFPRCPEDIEPWVQIGDFLQMNHAEATLLAEGSCGPVALGPAGVVITDGPGGVQYEVAAALLRSPPEWPLPEEKRLRSARGTISADSTATAVDPTGCGDVWGAVCFAGLLGGLGIRHAAERANRLAEVALGLRGATGLRAALASSSMIREGAS